jgi:ATP-dependent RNA circularization protein (DNA/RNA ligase family)
VFDIWDIEVQRYYSFEGKAQLCKELGLEMVPSLMVGPLIDYNIDNLLKWAEGKSVLNKEREREGVVFKSVDGTFSFKAISNEYLMGDGKE